MYLPTWGGRGKKFTSTQRNQEGQSLHGLGSRNWKHTHFSGHSHAGQRAHGHTQLKKKKGPTMTYIGKEKRFCK